MILGLPSLENRGAIQQGPMMGVIPDDFTISKVEGIPLIKFGSRYVVMNEASYDMIISLLKSEYAERIWGMTLDNEANISLWV